MSDDLDRIRRLRDDVPAAPDDWVLETRAELLAMAAEKEERQVAEQPGTMSGLRELLARFTANPSPIALAGTAMLVVVVAVAVALTGPASEEPAGPMAGETIEPESSPTTTTTTTTTPGDTESVVLASSCDGGDGAYTVGYPEGWHTNSGEVSDPCQRFDTEPVELESQTGGAPEQPVAVRVLPVGFDRAATPGEGERETSRTETTVAGRDAVVVERTSTGEAALPEGARSYRYLIDLDGQRTLMVVAYDLGGGSFDKHREVVDAMVDSLRIEDG